MTKFEAAHRLAELCTNLNTAPGVGMLAELQRLVEICNAGYSHDYRAALESIIEWTNEPDERVPPARKLCLIRNAAIAVL